MQNKTLANQMLFDNEIEKTARKNKSRIGRRKKQVLQKSPTWTTIKPKELKKTLITLVHIEDYD